MNKNIFHYPREQYSVAYGTLSFAEMKKEYSRLRAIAQKRLDRLEKEGFGDTRVYKYNKKSFGKTSDYSVVELQYKLQDVEHFLRSKASTVSGWKESNKKRLQALHEAGYDFINESNILNFGEFMEYWKENYADMGYSSEEIIDIFHNAADKGISPEELKKNFDEYLEKGKIDVSI